MFVKSKTATKQRKATILKLQIIPSISTLRREIDDDGRGDDRSHGTLTVESLILTRILTQKYPIIVMMRTRVPRYSKS
jgi:hypothetical protein